MPRTWRTHSSRCLPGAAEGGRHALEIPPRVDPGGEPAIEATDLTKRFGSFTAVNRVNFAIGRGEIFGFLGSNGCGKSTTMKMLTGLLPATEGEAKLFGDPVDANDLATRKRVGYMSQAFSLYGELTVRQNLDLHTRIFDLPRDRARPDRRTGRSVRPPRRISRRPRRTFRWGSSNGCPWPSPFCTSPTCSCSMSRPPGSTPSPATSSGSS